MSEIKKRIVIIGATSAIAEQCARLWVYEEAVDLILVGRNGTKMKAIADDLQVRSPNSIIHVTEMTLIDPVSIQKQINLIANEGPIDIALIAQGSLSDQTQCQQDLTSCHNEITINAISPVLFAEAIISTMQKANQGTLAIISSVAGDRGRKSNYIYGAAKALLSRYAEGLQHRLAKTNVKVVLLKPGPTESPMTEHLKNQGCTLARSEAVAQIIVKGINQGKAIVYAPSKWQWIMLIIKLLPNFIFNRINI